jgi:23S rRNA (cytosine1962-C5)-methyltransferase
MITLTVHQKRTGPIRGRHPWVFSGALISIPDTVSSGEEVKLIDETGKFLAYGYFNSYSQIAVRLWSWDETEVIGTDFFIKRITQAHELRRAYIASPQTNAYRLIYGENDLLPGLVVDCYGDYLSVQFHTEGMERWKDEIINALVKVVKPKGIYERSDVNVRSHEEMQPKVGILYGTVPDQIEIIENNLKFLVDIKEGQKTGFFLDQRDKRLALQKYVSGRKVLNCFSYTGGFSIYALALTRTT